MSNTHLELPGILWPATFTNPDQGSGEGDSNENLGCYKAARVSPSWPRGCPIRGATRQEVREGECRLHVAFAEPCHGTILHQYKRQTTREARAVNMTRAFLTSA